MRVIVAVETIAQTWQVEVDLGTGATQVRCDQRTWATAMYDGDGRWSHLTPSSAEFRQILARAEREIGCFDAVLREARTPAIHPL